eukprot:1181278-Rhodomonas_salina.3
MMLPVATAVLSYGLCYGATDTDLCYGATTDISYGATNTTVLTYAMVLPGARGKQAATPRGQTQGAGMSYAIADRTWRSGGVDR